MKLTRLSKKIGKPKVLGHTSEMDISWASGPGFKGGPENYFSISVEAEDYGFAVEFDVEESRRMKAQLDKFLYYIDNEKHRWEPGNHFRKLEKKMVQAKSSAKD